MRGKATQVLGSNNNPVGTYIYNRDSFHSSKGYLMTGSSSPDRSWQHRKKEWEGARRFVLVVKILDSDPHN